MLNSRSLQRFNFSWKAREAKSKIVVATCAALCLLSTGCPRDKSASPSNAHAYIEHEVVISGNDTIYDNTDNQADQSSLHYYDVHGPDTNRDRIVWVNKTNQSFYVCFDAQTGQPFHFMDPSPISPGKRRHSGKMDDISTLNVSYHVYRQVDGKPRCSIPPEMGTKGIPKIVIKQ